MKQLTRQKAGASISDSQAALSVVGTFQIVEDAVTALLGALKADNVTMQKNTTPYGFLQKAG